MWHPRLAGRRRGCNAKPASWYAEEMAPSSLQNPTDRLVALSLEIARERAVLSHGSALHRKELEWCIEHGADLDAPVKWVDQGALMGASVVELLVGRPDLALLVLPKTNQPGSGLSLALARTANACRSSTSAPGLVSDFRKLTHACARRFPGLDWYEYAPNPAGYFYTLVPAALIIEEQSPGFNEILEAEQEAKALPVGRQIQGIGEREEAIRDLMSNAPMLFWLGQTPRVEWLRRLMRDDVDPNLQCEDRGVKLLESILSNQPQLDLVDEVISRGALVSSVDIIAIVNRMNGDRSPPEADAILCRLLSSGQMTLESDMRYNPPLSVREYLHEKVPQALAVIDQVSLQSETTLASGLRSSLRI